MSAGKKIIKEISLKKLCEALQIKLSGSRFWKFYWKKLAAKISFKLLKTFKIFR